MLERTRAKWKHAIRQRLFGWTNMQAMLDLDERHALEDSMGFRGQWDEHRRFQLAELKRRGLKPHNRMVEIGCGPLTAGIPVIEYLDAGKYVGVDVRESVLNLAWQQIGKAGLSGKNPRLIRSDDFGEGELGDATVDFMWSFSVFFHMTDAILDGCLASVSKRLAANGRCYANVMTDMDSSTWLQFPFLRRTIEDYRTIAARHGLTTTELGTIASLGFTLAGDESNNILLEFKRA